MRRFVMIGFGVMLGAAGVAGQDVPALPATVPAVAGLQQTPPSTPPTRQTQTPPPGQGRGAPTPGVQQPAPQPAPQGGQPPPPPPGARGQDALPSSWQNIRVDVTITDSLSAEQVQRKTVSMLVLDNRSGQVRSMGSQGMINVDASPLVRPDGKIYLRITMEYNPDLNPQMAQAANTSTRTSFNESLSLVVNDGKPLLVSQAADPRSDRKVTVEVTATVQK
jgi:hypothetical protein